MFLPLNFTILVAQFRRMSTYLAGDLLAVVTTFESTFPGFVTGRLGRYNVITVTPFLSTTLPLARWLPARRNVPQILFTAFYRFSSKYLGSLAFCRDSAGTLVKLAWEPEKCVSGPAFSLHEMLQFSKNGMFQEPKLKLDQEYVA